jgi:hypothetical protein
MVAKKIVGRDDGVIDPRQSQGRKVSAVIPTDGMGLRESPNAALLPL